MHYNIARFEVFMVMKIHIKALCVVTLCSDVVRYSHFGGPYCHTFTTCYVPLWAWVYHYVHELLVMSDIWWTWKKWENRSFF